MANWRDSCLEIGQNLERKTLLLLVLNTGTLEFGYLRASISVKH